MRINLNTATVIPEGQAEARAQQGSTPRSTLVGSHVGDSQFSASRASTTSLAASALESPEVRTGKVEALQAQIQAGTYQVSPQQIAASLLDQLRTER